MDFEKYKALFVDEATDHLAEMSRALAALESRERAGAEESIDTLFRMAHSIKGMAGSLDFESVASLAHGLESWLEPLRAAGELPDGALPLVYEVVATLEEMVAEVDATGEPPASRDGLLARLEQNEYGGEDLPRVREARSSPKARSTSRRRRCRAPSAFAPRRSTASSRPWES